MLDFKHMNTIKEIRNARLTSTDKCLFEDYECCGALITTEQRDEIKAYRKLLKDFPSTLDELTDSNDAVFPEAPEWFEG